MRSNEGDLKHNNYGGCETAATSINGDYLRLDGAVDNLPQDSAPPLADNGDGNRSGINSAKIRLLVKILIVCVILSVPAVIFIKRVGPEIMRKAVIPTIKWLINTFSPLALAAILFAGIALLPVFLLPTVPFKWVAGMTFGYVLGFLLIIGAVAVAVSLPYFIGRHLFLHKIKKWLDEHPREAGIVRLAGDGDWFHQFKAIALIRLSPFPYVVFNYTAVVTGVSYGPYLAGSVSGMVPEILVAMYSGKLIRTLAEAMEEHTSVSRFQIILDGTGFCLTVAATIIIGFYSKAKLKQLQEEEQRQQLL